MKLTGWLFEEQENRLTTEEQLGILSDYIMGDLSSIFPNAKIQSEIKGKGERFVIWDLKNNLQLVYNIKHPRIDVHFTNPTRGVSSIKIENITYESFKKEITAFFQELIGKIEKHSEFERTVPKIVQEIVDYFDAGPPVELTRIGKPQSNKINLMFDQNPDNIVQIEVENIQTNIFLWFRIVQDAEINTISGFSMNLGDSFEDKFEIKWNEIRTRLIDWISG